MTQDFSTTSFIAGIMAGMLLAGAWFFGGSGAFLAGDSLSGQSDENRQQAPSSGAVSVSDQPAGDSVVVESVTVPPPGVWVAVREIIGSDLGNVLGALRVSGPRTSIAVPLLRATEPGRAYAVQLYRDDNQGAFDPAKNSVYVDFDTGLRVVAYFNAAE